ncbi:MAG: hypothetical protein AAFQ64_17125 [Pseudomonadota bacterium]
MEKKFEVNRSSEFRKKSVNYAVATASILSLPASLTVFYNYAQKSGIDPLVFGLTAAATTVAAAIHWRSMSTKRAAIERQKLEIQRLSKSVANLEQQLSQKADDWSVVDALEHDMLHSFRNHAIEISVLAQNNSLTRDQFDSKLDQLLQGACGKIKKILQLRTSQAYSVAIHLINDEGTFPFVGRDKESYKLRARGQHKSVEGLSTGMLDVIEADPRSKPVVTYDNIATQFPDYVDVEIENPADFYDCATTVAIQARVVEIVRNRFKRIFPRVERTIAGFLTIEASSSWEKRSLCEEALSKYADSLFLTLNCFAWAELNSFGEDEITIGHIATELYGVRTPETVGPIMH